jgi:hypothetical protein
MGSKQIRTGQLIAPFGTGSLYTDRHGVPHVVAGLDHWYRTWDKSRGMVDCSQPDEFEFFERRLSELLGVDRFCTPPDLRVPLKYQEAPPNANLKVPALRFPRWYRNTRSGELRRLNLHTSKVDHPRDGSRWQPVRFVAVCGHGHLCEFPWKEWIHCQCPGDGEMELNDRGGSELSSITVRCRSCAPGSAGAKGRNLSGTTVPPDKDKNKKTEFEKASIRCPADRPWLGQGAQEGLCAEPLVGALINQTNIYFPRTISAISLPDLNEQDDEVLRLRTAIDALTGIGMAKMLWRLKQFEQAKAAVASGLEQEGITFDPGKLMEALERHFSGTGSELHAGSPHPAQPETQLMRFRRDEYNVLRQNIDDPTRFPELRVRKGRVPTELSAWVGGIGLVERLCETRVFFGFDRLAPSTSPLEEMPSSAFSQLFRTPPEGPERWLPAVRVYGEGIYIELHDECVRSWQRDNADWLRNRLAGTFITRLEESCWALRPLAPGDRDWGSRFLLVHSLAHLIMNQLVFECGYSTASLRERLFVSADPKAPMAAFLIYTAAGDSEGTLGGLVRLAEPALLGPMFQRAMARASWCSADPVCSETLGGRGSRLVNLAACHACTLLPETSCETINQGLDRGMVVGTPGRRATGFLSRLVDEVPEDD